MLISMVLLTATMETAENTRSAGRSGTPIRTTSSSGPDEATSVSIGTVIAAVNATSR